MGSQNSILVIGGGISGIQSALDIAEKTLVGGGHFVCKIFQGSDYKAFTDNVKAQFQRQTALRPKSTRKASREVFVIGLGKK